MSTIKTTNISHGSNSGTANVVLDSSGNATVNGNLTVTGTGTGRVVGFSIATSTSNSQNPSAQDTWTLVGPQITYTAASASNKLLVLHNHHIQVEDMHWGMALFRDGTSGTNLYTMRTYAQSEIWQSAMGITHVTADAPDTSSHTYQFAIIRYSGSANDRLSYSSHSDSSGSQIILLELEP